MSQDPDKILYPSVTLCKKYTFDEYIDETFKEESTNLTYVQDKVDLNTWPIERLFYFFSHPGQLELRFPCTTGLGGTDPGKPCVFSTETEFGDADYDIIDRCYKLDTPTESCWTRAEGLFRHFEGFRDKS